MCAQDKKEGREKKSNEGIVWFSAPTYNFYNRAQKTLWNTFRNDRKK